MRLHAAKLFGMGAEGSTGWAGFGGEKKRKEKRNGESAGGEAGETKLLEERETNVCSSSLSLSPSHNLSLWLTLPQTRECS